MLQLIFGGISQGCIYGLIALGFVLIYKATETISFAQGELMMVGAFGAAGNDEYNRKCANAHKMNPSETCEIK